MTARSRALRRGLHPKHPLQITTRTPRGPAFKFELLPLHSPLLRQSLLVSFPPLIDMLKFSGYPYLIRGQPGSNDARTGMPPGIPGGAMCVQRLDDSLNSAIHITYRISLRSSSMPEPRDPLLKVLTDYDNQLRLHTFRTAFMLGSSAGAGPGARGLPGGRRNGGPAEATRYDRHGWEVGPRGPSLGNDPSAGSPTETLLR
ncbi:hypothetical protein P174DRAFT_479324, partial [Aspergillus novofumigatus IBT 16806]